MAKIQRKLSGDYETILKKIEDGILDGSISATLEDQSDFNNGKIKCSVRVFERYSFFGKNRVSLNVTLLQSNDKDIWLSAITSGGSRAIFIKFNTLSEQAFLNKLIDVLDNKKTDNMN